MPILAPKHLGAFILLLLVTALPLSTAESTYYVKPTLDTPCQEDPCHTLSEYVSEAEQYFSSNTTMVFLPGEHVLQENLTVRNIGRLAFTRNPSSSPTDVSRIICTDAIVTFTNLIILEIADLGFHSCTIQLGSSSAVFKNCSFENSVSNYGGAIYAYSSTITFDGETRFEGNSAAVAGGGIFAEESNITFHGNTTFINNEAVEGGGGINLFHCDVIFAENLATIVRELKSSQFGGGILYYGYSSSHLDFENTVIFLDNSAVNGGGILVNYSTVSFSGGSQFINNSAECNGGGIYVVESNVSFGDHSGFTDNTAEVGGGVCVEWYSTVSFGDDSRFINNSANYGGGVNAWWGSNVSFGEDIRFIDDSATYFGGGVCVWFFSTLNFGDNSRFINNSAVERGGGLYVPVNSSVNFGDNSGFINNSALFGGGVYVLCSTVSFGDNCSFISNSALDSGGINAWHSTVSFGDDSSFINNSAVWRGGGLYVMENSNVSFGGNSGFMNNSAENGGGFEAWESNVSFGHDSSFIDNSAEWLGGGVFVLGGSMVSFGDDNGFINNSAEDGGGVYVEESNVRFGDDSRFINNSAENDGGGVYVRKSNVSFADSDFMGNLADYFGGCMAAKESTIDLGGSSKFMNNLAMYGGCIFVDTCNLTFSKVTIFSGNSAITSNWYSGGSGNVYDGGGILASGSNLTFGGSHVLTNNSAGYGGAVYLTLDSTIYLLPGTTISFERNFAQYRGGALFVEHNPFTYCILDSDVQTSVRDACFIQIHVFEAGCTPVFEDYRPYLDQGNELQFYNNSAKEAGSILYGGNLDSCGVCTVASSENYVPWEEAFNTWVNISRNFMSSDPYQLCICVDNHPDCNQSNTTREIFPGMTFVVRVVAFGQYDGPVPAVTQTYISEGITLDALQHTQWSNNTCTNLQYTARSTRAINIWSEATLILYAAEPCSTLGVPLEVFVTFLPCPVGFSFSTEGSCECDQRLNKYDVDCDINDQSILRKDSIWIGFIARCDNQTQGLILHPHCPFDYCKPESDSVNFTMNNTDLQCNYNRLGHLCGACKHGFSLAVGSSRCLPCSNKFLSLLIAFVLAGLALVVFLLIFKVTVAAGTISGLIFYANVVRVNQSILFPSGETNVLTVFIAWLNLDLGIEACFFDGMDTYYMMWLQFVFPIYIWLLVGLITILCNISTTAARILGSTNPIAVLATLFLLSYTKLLRTIIAAFSFTTLEYPDGETKVVWLYDGNIGYLDNNDGRHIALFLASLLVFLFFFLSYTLFLLSGQCILPRLDLNKLRWLSWANYVRMKSFLDAYHAPHKDRHRYWIGMLLVIRFVLFLISAIVDVKSPQDPHVNQLVIIICTSILGMWACSGVYKRWYLNVLESSFILNLVILAAATLYAKLAGGNQAVVFCTSVTFAFSTFIGIVIYHGYQRLRDSTAWRNLVHKHNQRRRARDHGWQREDTATDEETEEMLPQVAPTVSYVEIPTDERREMRPITPPLSRNFIDVREPLDHLQRKDAAADEEVEEMLTPTVSYIPAAKAICTLTPPPLPINFTEVRDPLDLLTQ